MGKGYWPQLKKRFYLISQVVQKEKFSEGRAAFRTGRTRRRSEAGGAQIKKLFIKLGGF